MIGLETVHQNLGVHRRFSEIGRTNNGTQPTFGLGVVGWTSGIRRESKCEDRFGLDLDQLGQWRTTPETNSIFFGNQT